MSLFNKKLNILVLGNNGMLGYEVYERLLKLSSLKNQNIGSVIGIDVKDGIDIASRHSLGNFFMNSIHFDYCINCIAYTDTKKAETTKEGREIDYKLNALAPKYIAESCKFWKTKLIHISTDYVFSEKSYDMYKYNDNDSDKFCIPFKENSEPFPCNVYGYDKLLGEMNIENVFGKNSKDYCILRTSWIYGMHNNKSFIHKFINNLVKSIKEGKTELEMTSDEYSIPTSCDFVVSCIQCVIREKTYGIFHAVPHYKNNNEEKLENIENMPDGISRYEYANKILQFIKNGKYKIADEKAIDFSKISLAEIQRDSYWPKYSVMRSSFVYSQNWDIYLEMFLNNNIEDILKSALT